MPGDAELDEFYKRGEVLRMDAAQFLAGVDAAIPFASQMPSDAVIIPSPADLAYRVKNLQSDFDALAANVAAEREARKCQARQEARQAAISRRQRRKQLPQWSGLYRPLKQPQRRK